MGNAFQVTKFLLKLKKPRYEFLSNASSSSSHDDDGRPARGIYYVRNTHIGMKRKFLGDEDNKMIQDDPNRLCIKEDENVTSRLMISA